jgi:Recombination endonuclease VII
MRNTEGIVQGRILGDPLALQIGEQCLVSGQVNDERCPLCGRMALLEQDHDHTTDLCRGRICHSCNLLVGRFDRPIEEIQRFLNYLAHWRAEHANGQAQTYTEYMRAFAPRFRQKGRGRWQHAQVA